MSFHTYNRFNNRTHKENKDYTSSTVQEQIPFNIDNVVDDLKHVNVDYLLSVVNTKWNGVTHFRLKYFAKDELCSRFPEFKQQVDKQRNSKSNNPFVFTDPRKPKWTPNVNTKTFQPHPPTTPYPQPPPPNTPYTQPLPPITPTTKPQPYKPPQMKNDMNVLENKMNNFFLGK
jgi:hypothetical protein